MNPRRWYGPVVIGLLASGGLAYLAARRTWATTVIGAGELPGSTIETAGIDALGLIGALALVVMASALGVLASAGRVRQGVGVFVLLVALGGVAATLVDLGPTIAEAVAIAPVAVDDSGLRTDASLWRHVTTAGFALTGLLSLAVVRWGAAWPSMSSRYDAPSRRRDEAVTEADMWKALDDGDDPTQ